MAYPEFTTVDAPPAAKSGEDLPESTKFEPGQYTTALSGSNTPSDADSRGSDPRSQLAAMDWEDLESRFEDAMAKHKTDEQALYHEFSQLSNFFAYWLGASIEHDTERASKRLKTRIKWVQRSEDKVALKQQKYIAAVRALEDAMALV